MNTAQILDKINKTSIPKVKKVALAFSGGLDSSLCIELLRRIYKVEEIIPITIDVGQGMQEMELLHKNAKALNITPLIIDAKEEFCKEWLPKAIHANANYNGYPVSTSMTRQLVARIVAEQALKFKCDAIMEGSTGKGNDQYRMHNVFKLFAPDLEILVPVRDFNLTRLEETALCNEWNIPINEEIIGGDDKTMWCRSIASGGISLNQELPDSIWMWLKSPKTSESNQTKITIEFKNGIPVALDQKLLPLDQIIETLNILGGSYGIGLIDMFEDGIMGLKSREIYEAPAADIILKLHNDLEQWCLTKEEIQFKKIIDNQWAYLVYHGMWYHPLKKALDSFVQSTQKGLNGIYDISVFPGNFKIIKRTSQNSLFFPEVRSISSISFDQRWSKNAAKILGLPFEILALRKKKLKQMEQQHV
jgi:argininosuccinate synthase